MLLDDHRAALETIGLTFRNFKLILCSFMRCALNLPRSVLLRIPARGTLGGPPGRGSGAAGGTQVRSRACSPPARDSAAGRKLSR
ncbi:hypothetical protein CapIbe_020013 [Capra ibex]